MNHHHNTHGDNPHPLLLRKAEGIDAHIMYGSGVLWAYVVFETL